MAMAELTDPIHVNREAGSEPAPRRSTLNIVLWVVQVLLGLLFLWAGGMKLVLPLEKLAGPVHLPGLFLRFIGVAELLGGIGLILPGLLRIRPGLTPWAAAGLVIIMIGAVGITLASGGRAAPRVAGGASRAQVRRREGAMKRIGGPPLSPAS